MNGVAVGGEIDVAHAPAIAPPGAETVEEFCAREGLSEYVRMAVDLVPRYFRTAGPVRCEVDYSHETDESWVTLCFEVRGDVEQTLDWYDRYTEALLEVVPWPQSDRLRLFFW